MLMLFKSFPPLVYVLSNTTLIKFSSALLLQKLYNLGKMSIPKPLLRGQLNRNMGRSMIIGVVIGIIGTAAFKFLYADPKKQKYADFYKNYDPMPDFRRMRDLGLLHSAKPGDPE